MPPGNQTIDESQRQYSRHADLRHRVPDRVADKRPYGLWIVLDDVAEYMRWQYPSQRPNDEGQCGNRECSNAHAPNPNSIPVPLETGQPMFGPDGLVGYDAGMTRYNIIRVCRFLLCVCAVIYVLLSNTFSRWTGWILAAIVLALLAVEYYESKSRR